MKKVKHILEIFVHSLIPQDIYYPKLLHTRLLFSIQYYLVVIIFFSLLYTSIAFYQFSPKTVLNYKISLINSLSTFPKEAILSVTNGVLESNLNRPLFLWVYQNNQPLFVFVAHGKEALTKVKISLPFVFLGSEKVQFSYKGTIIQKSYDHDWNIHITKERVQSFIAYIDSIFPSFIFFFYLSLLIVLPLLFIGGSTALILLLSAIVFVLLRTFIPHIHLKKCIQAGLHGTHLPLLTTIFLFMLFPSMSNIIIIATALIFIFTLVATYEMYSKELFQRSGR